MSDLRIAAQQALEALGHVVRQAQENLVPTIHYGPVHDVMNNLRSALAQEQAEPVAGIIEPRIEEDSRQTFDEAMQQPRAMAQAYENGYKAGVANEREACAKVCDFHVARLSAIDEPRPALAVGICAAAIRARGNT